MDIPPSHLTTSINQLRSFSTALSAFISRYDELHNHFNFINSSIHSILPNNGNQSAITCLLETYCDHTITASPEVVVSEQNPKEFGNDCERSYESATTLDCTSFSHDFEEIDASKNLEVVDASKKHVEIDAPNKHADADTSKMHDQTTNDVRESVVSEQNRNGMATNCEMDEVVDVWRNPEDICALEKHAETNTLKKHEETVREDQQTITYITEAVVSEQNPNRMATDCEQGDENDVSKQLEAIDVFKQPEQIDILNKHEQADNCKNPEGTAVLNKAEEVDKLDASMISDEIDTSKKPDETVPEAIVTKQNPTRKAIDHKQSHGNVSKKPKQIDILKKPEQNDTCKNPEETVVLKKHGEIDTSKSQEEIVTLNKHDEISYWKIGNETEASKKSVVSELEYLCQSMRSMEMKWHVAEFFYEMVNLREEIAKALKLAEDPAKLVLDSIGAFFIHDSRAFCQKKRYLERNAAVLILECFVMISSDGIEIGKGDQESAAKAAVGWKNRMISEGGPRHTDVVDARGLLLLISGFGIQDHVFKIRDIVELIRASNVKEVSTALRRSVFLVPKFPEVIELMVKNNLEIEAADIAYTFRLEDKCHPLNILATYLRKHIRNIQNGSFFHKFEEMKQQLFDLESVKQCLESHNIDPSMHLPDFKINERIQDLEKEINKAKLIQKKKSLDNPIHQEAKLTCFGHENMPRQPSPIDHYGMKWCYRSTQPSTGYFDSNRNLHNNYTTNYSPSSVRNAPAVRETITGPVSNGPAGGFRGSYDQTVHMGHTANVQPNGWHEPYVQHYSRHGQTYDSLPYGRKRPRGWGTPEPFPGFHPGGFPGRRGPSSDLYGFADMVERESQGFHA